MADEILLQNLPGPVPSGFPAASDLRKDIAVLVSLLKKEQKIPSDVSISVSLVSDQSMQQLNRNFRGKDRTTDVLSFSQIEGMEFPDIEPLPLGDIVISRAQCIRQASDKGHSPEHELHILLIHGLYHLLGFDHETSEKDARQMERLEKKLLRWFLKERGR